MDVDQDWVIPNLATLNCNLLYLCPSVSVSLPHHLSKRRLDLPVTHAMIGDMTVLSRFSLTMVFTANGLESGPNLGIIC